MIESMSRHMTELGNRDGMVNMESNTERGRNRFLDVAGHQ